MKIAPGEVVIAVLHSPREKLIGVLDEITPAGVTMRAVDLGYFDDWCRSIAEGDPALGMSDYFFPMWRIERVTRDEGTAEIPSMSDQFLARTGKEMSEQ